jgi:hypothetical protein
MIQNTKLWPILGDMFHLDPPYNEKVIEDFANMLFYQLLDLQYGTNETIDRNCETMWKTNLNSIEKLAEISRSVVQKKQVSDENFLWNWQYCTEFGWFQSNSAIIPNYYYTMQDYFEKYCSKNFGEQLDIQQLEKNIQGINEEFGGMDLMVSNLILVNGAFDPWHAVGRIEGCVSECQDNDYFEEMAGNYNCLRVRA